MFGVEAGLDWRKGDAIFRTTLFWQEVSDLIGNATISLGPSPLRQRQNLGTATGRGVELEVLKTFGPFRAEAAYLYVDSQLDTNVWMPQVPRHQGSFQLLYAAGGTLFRGGIRSSAAQFEDDLNRFLLPGFLTLQVIAATPPGTWRLGSVCRGEPAGSTSSGRLCPYSHDGHAAVDARRPEMEDRAIVQRLAATSS